MHQNPPGRLIHMQTAGLCHRFLVLGVSGEAGGLAVPLLPSVADAAGRGTAFENHCRFSPCYVSTRTSCIYVAHASPGALSEMQHPGNPPALLVGM